MRIYTDNTTYVQQTLLPSIDWKPLIKNVIPTKAGIHFSSKEFPYEFQTLLRKYFQSDEIATGLIPINTVFKHLFIKKFVSFSQFDFLIQLSKEFNDPQGGLICFAGGGDKFHGFRQREWASLIGNIHLSIILQPRIKVRYADTAFLILAANAVTQTINQLHRLDQPAKIKWVNDILIKNAKVGGVLAQTQIQKGIIESVIIGIGVNVNEYPQIKNDSIVTGATSINSHISGEKYKLAEILWSLISNIDQNYRLILQNNYESLLQYYINNSMVIGKRVEIISDPRTGDSELIAEGRVLSISENLELILSGIKKPLRKGRIIVKDGDL